MILVQLDLLHASLDIRLTQRWRLGDRLDVLQIFEAEYSQDAVRAGTEHEVLQRVKADCEGSLHLNIHPLLEFLFGQREQIKVTARSQTVNHLVVHNDTDKYLLRALV